MDVTVAVRLPILQAYFMDVRVVLIVDVPVLVLHQLVRLVVGVSLGEVEPA